jgi:rhamnosyltransferase
MIIDKLGKAESAGVKYMLSEQKYLWKNAPHFIPNATLRLFIKYGAYALGKKNRFIPYSLSCYLSRHPGFWRQKRVLSEQSA